VRYRIAVQQDLLVREIPQKRGDRNAPQKQREQRVLALLFVALFLSLRGA
jgi:hypothetical protein